MYLYWSKIYWENSQFFLAATDKGLCYVGSPDAPFSELETWAKRKLSNYTLIEDHTKLSSAAAAIKSFLNGDNNQIALPLDIIGTTFQQQVWQAMNDVPYGEVVTYSDIAKKIDKPKAVRAVGTAIGANPLMIVLPCHRIVAKDGSLAGFRGGLAMKEKLLTLEKQ